MIAIVDTTLRDGEQTPGVAFSLDEKLAIARRLDEAGVDYIEAGTPVMGGTEYESVRAIARAGLRARVIAWCRAVEADARVALSTGASDIHLSLPVSDLMINRKLGRDRAWVLGRLNSVARIVTDAGATLSVGAEDATRAGEEFVLRYALAAQDAGAARLRYCDTVGMAEPFTLAENIARLTGALDIPVEIHTHNDFGLATANALAAVRSAGPASLAAAFLLFRAFDIAPWRCASSMGRQPMCAWSGCACWPSLPRGPRAAPMVRRNPSWAMACSRTNPGCMWTVCSRIPPCMSRSRRNWWARAAASSSANIRDARRCRRYWEKRRPRRCWPGRARRPFAARARYRAPSWPRWPKEAAHVDDRRGTGTIQAPDAP
ncbi:MAG: hypothetical protein HY804_05505 [Nitrospinae bacterium]|nr:hypothetical protein [Nitrospinota bacterium]